MTVGARREEARGGASSGPMPTTPEPSTEERDAAARALAADPTPRLRRVARILAAGCGLAVILLLGRLWTAGGLVGDGVAIALLSAALVSGLYLALLLGAARPLRGVDAGDPAEVRVMPVRVLPLGEVSHALRSTVPVLLITGVPSRRAATRQTTLPDGAVDLRFGVVDGVDGGGRQPAARWYEGGTLTAFQLPIARTLRITRAAVREDRGVLVLAEPGRSLPHVAGPAEPPLAADDVPPVTIIPLWWWLLLAVVPVALLPATGQDVSDALAFSLLSWWAGLAAVAVVMGIARLMRRSDGGKPPKHPLLGHLPATSRTARTPLRVWAGVAGVGVVALVGLLAAASGAPADSYPLSARLLFVVGPLTVGALIECAVAVRRRRST